MKQFSKGFIFSLDMVSGALVTILLISLLVTVLGVPANSSYSGLSLHAKDATLEWLYSGGHVPIYSGGDEHVCDLGYKPLNTVNKLDPSSDDAWVFSSNCLTGATAESVNEGKVSIVSLENFLGLGNPVSGTSGSYRRAIVETASGVIAIGLVANGNAYVLASSDGGETWNKLLDGDFATTQAPVMVADNQDRIIAIAKNDNDSCEGHFLRFDQLGAKQYQLTKDTCFGDLGTKWSATFDKLTNTTIVSRRQNTNDLGIVRLDESGNPTPVGTGSATGVNIVENVTYPGGANGGNWDIDTQYHSIVLGPNGELHLFYNAQVHNSPTLADNYNQKALYLKSEDGGITWLRGDNTPVTLPVKVDDYDDSLNPYPNGAQPISYYTGPNGQQGYVTNILVRGDSVHLLYLGSSGTTKSNVFYVRLNRITGVEEIRQPLSVYFHSFFVEDPYSSNLYIFGRSTVNGKQYPTVFKSTDNGATWPVYTVIDLPADVEWDRFSGMPFVSKDRYIYAAGQIEYDVGATDVDTYFFKVGV